MTWTDVGKDVVYCDLHSGGDQAVLMPIHGSGGDHTSWPETLRRMPHVTVGSVDLPGHGQSRGAGRCQVSDYADGIAAVIETRGWRHVFLLGHSLGGAICQILALRQPSWLAGIVLVGTGARLRVAPAILDGLLQDFEATVDLIAQYAFGPHPSAELVSEFKAQLRQTPAAITHGDFSACNQFDIIPQLSDIQCPTLVVSATHDRLTPLKYGEFLAQHVPNAELAVIENAGHMMALERPNHFADIIRAWLP